jgi:hypothetical protein
MVIILHTHSMNVLFMFFMPRSILYSPRRVDPLCHHTLTPGSQESLIGGISLFLCYCRVRPFPVCLVTIAIRKNSIAFLILTQRPLHVYLLGSIQNRPIYVPSFITIPIYATITISRTLTHIHTYYISVFPSYIPSGSVVTLPVCPPFPMMYSHYLTRRALSGALVSSVLIYVFTLIYDSCHYIYSCRSRTCRRVFTTLTRYTHFSAYPIHDHTRLVLLQTILSINLIYISTITYRYHLYIAGYSPRSDNGSLPRPPYASVILSPYGYPSRNLHSRLEIDSFLVIIILITSYHSSIRSLPSQALPLGQSNKEFLDYTYPLIHTHVLIRFVRSSFSIDSLPSRITHTVCSISISCLSHAHPIACVRYTHTLYAYIYTSVFEP